MLRGVWRGGGERKRCVGRRERWREEEVCGGVEEVCGEEKEVCGKGERVLRDGRWKRCVGRRRKRCVGRRER